MKFPQRHFVFVATIVATIAWVATPGCRQTTTDAIVSGGSMAPTFPGEHFQLQCNDCHYQFAIDANNVPQSGNAVCPLCGYRQCDFRKLPLQPADKMLVTPIGKTAAADAINRWDVIAFVEPDADNRGEQRLLTKRVVGLPGETIRFQAGNLFVDDRIARKPVSLYEQICIPIFDSRFPTRSNPNRFAPAKPNSGWRKVTEGVAKEVANGWTFELSAEPTNDGTFDWLDYQPIRGYRHSGERNQVHSIEDSYGYNQNVARELHLVNEFKLRFQYQQTNPTGQTQLAVSLANQNRTRCQIEFDFGLGKLVVDTGDGVKKEITSKCLNSQNSQLEISNIDNQLRILCNDEEVYLETDFEKLASDNSVERDLNRTAMNAIENGPMPAQIQIGARGGNGLLSNLQIYRDIYYYRDGRHTAVFPNETVMLGANEYFVLGDNAPISVDSRVFGAIRKDSIVGSVNRADTAN